MMLCDCNVCALQGRVEEKKAVIIFDLLADPGLTFFSNNSCDNMDFVEKAEIVSESNSDARQL